MSSIYEIRMHGIGGQGVAAAADILGVAAVKDKRWAHSFPFFGTEIRGGVVSAYTRISDGPIHTRSFIYNPDLLVVFAGYLVTSEVLEGLKENSIVLINNCASLEDLPTLKCRNVMTIDGDNIARSISGTRVANGPILGAIAALSKQVSMSNLEIAIDERFSQEIARATILGARVGYEQFKGKEVKQ